MRPAIVFLDLEGTLLRKAVHLDNLKVAPSAWTVLAEALGPDALAEEERSKDRWLDGGYANYLEWMTDSIRIFRKHGLTQAIFDRVVDSVQIVDGAPEAIETFRKWGAKTALISGGFKALADKVQLATKIDHAFSSCELFFEPKTLELVHWNLLPADYHGKADFMRLLMREYAVDPRNCAFVGDGKNDVPLASQVGVSIAFNAQRELSEVCTYVVDQPNGRPDFSEVISLIDQHEN